MKKILRSILKTIIPNRWFPLSYLHHRTVKLAKGQIHSGPFRGMNYIDQAYASSICSKLIGTYEKEIQKIIYVLLNIEFDTFLDIGAAEGYYSVGFAKYGKCKKITTYDGMSEARVLQKKLASINEVDNLISIKGKCTSKILCEDLSPKNNFIICDVEGYEYALLDPKLVPQLAYTTMIVECHNHVWEKMEESIKERFSVTHNISSFNTEINGKPSDYPFRNLYYNLLPRKYKDYPLIDHRDLSTSWLYLVPI